MEPLLPEALTAIETAFSKLFSVASDESAGGAADGVAATGTMNIAGAAATLPEGMSQVEFGQLAGFSQGLEASSQASTVPTAEALAGLKAAGVTSDSIAAFQQFYSGVAAANPANLSAIQRAALLANIFKAY